MASIYIPYKSADVPNIQYFAKSFSSCHPMYKTQQEIFMDVIEIKFPNLGIFELLFMVHSWPSRLLLTAKKHSKSRITVVKLQNFSKW